MELAIPLVALGGLYIVSNQSKTEKFTQRYEGSLPNINIPDKNYAQQTDPTNDLTSKLSTVNVYDGNSAYTDKYFNPTAPNTLVSSQSAENSTSFSGQTPNPATSQYQSLTGQKVGSDYFQHNNMQPYFGSRLRTIRTESNSNEGILDNYTGTGSQTITKTERAPLFSPQENMQYAYGAPNSSDFYQSRVNPSQKMANVKPFPQQMVGSGIGAGYGTDGKDGYNSALFNRNLYMPRTADELRVDNKPKAGENRLFGHEGPAMSHITARGNLGIQEKNRPDTTFEMGQDHLFTTVGIETAPALRAMGVTQTKDNVVNRMQMSENSSYTGVAGGTVDATYADGQYMPSKHIDLGALPFNPAYRGGAGGGNEADHGMKSKMIYQNNRTANQQDTYFGSFGSAIGAVVAPLLDALRPSRRENTIGTLRPYQNPGTTVANSYVFNPADRTRTTIKQTTEQGNGHLFVTGRNNADGYLVTPVDLIKTNRQTQEDFYYAGNSSAGERGREPRAYDAEYNQRNNEVKSSTLMGYTPNGGTGLLNNSINMTAVNRDAKLVNNRALDPTMPYQSVSLETMGQQSSFSQNSNTYQNIQLDRNQGDILTQLKGNPFAISHLNGL